MPIDSVTTDPDALTMTLVCSYDVEPERLWALWLDARQVERFWGPPTFPATFLRHDMWAGGQSHYVMTGPEGDRHRGYWTMFSVDAPNSFTLDDGFADVDGSPNDDLPVTRMALRIDPSASGSTMTIESTFPDRAAFDQLVDMGMADGMEAAFGQIDDVLASTGLPSADDGTTTDLLDDTTVRITRLIRASPDDVWRAHHDDQLVPRWLLGPDGWSMPVCITATEPGEAYRYEWQSDTEDHRFGFEGALVEWSAPHRAVTTEQMIDTEGPSTLNDLSIRACGDDTLLTLVVTYPSRELRDEILATGMTSGMEASYRRLESVLAD